MSKVPIAERFLLAFVALPFVLLSGVLASGAVVRTYRIVSGSMEPTLPMGSRLVSMRATSASSGEIITFTYPLNPAVTFVSRVVAVGGDTVQIWGKRLLVNGKEVAEPFVVHGDPTVYPNNPNLPEPYRSRDYFGPFRVPPGTFFVLSDNRDRASDSRYWGGVPQANLRGRVILLYSWSRGFWKPDAR